MAIAVALFGHCFIIKYYNNVRLLPSHVHYSTTVRHVLATMLYSLVVIGWEVLVSPTHVRQATVATCVFVMERYFQHACDRLDLEQCANDFCANSEHQHNVFDNF